MRLYRGCLSSIDDEFADTTVDVTVVKAWPQRRVVAGENTGLRLDGKSEIGWFGPRRDQHAKD